MNFYLGQRDELVAMHRDFIKQLKEMKENFRVKKEKERLEQEKLRLEQEQKERQEKERKEKERHLVKQPVKRSLNFSNVPGQFQTPSYRPYTTGTSSSSVKIVKVFCLCCHNFALLIKINFHGILCSFIYSFYSY